LSLYNPHQSKQREADKIEQNYLEKRKIQRQKNGDDRQYKERLVVDSREKPLGNQHENDKG
jgi:hypothetical protein